MENIKSKRKDNALERIDRPEFTSRFPLTIPAFTVRGIQSGTITAERDTALSGIFKGSLVVRKGANAIIHGIVEGSVRVEAGSIVYCDAIVKGDFEVAGSACVEGIVAGSIRTTREAILALDALVSGEVADSL